MLTNIQSLFADILQTPQQRAMQLTNEGLNRAELATRGLSGGAAMLSPLIAAEARTAPMREEMLSRSLGRLFGQDVRTESESIQNTLSQADTSTPEGQQALITALRNQGYGAQAAQLQQQMAEQAMALEDRERQEELRIASLKSSELRDQLTESQLQESAQQMDIRAAGLEAQEEQRALEETARTAAVARQEALATWFTGRENTELAALARAGVVTPTNLDSFVVDDKPIIMGEGSILVNPNTNEIIATNPRTREQVTRDYSLTGPEFDTYKTIIDENEDILSSFQTNRSPLWPGVTTNENKIKILIDSAERLRTQNPELSKEAALRQALAQSPSQAAAPVQGQPLPLVTTQEEWARIPRGQQYTAPDGQVRTKQ